MSRRRVVPRLILSLALLVAAPAVFGQFSPYCQLETPAPALVRAEGVAEKVNDIIGTCTGGAAGTQVTFNLTVAFNSALATSRRLTTNTEASEALLLIDELAEAPVLGTNVFQGQSLGNQLVFLDVKFTMPGTGKRKFRVTNLRANVRDLPAGALVQASVAISNLLTFTNPVLDVAVKAPGVFFSLQPDSGALSHRLRFQEGFVTSFRKRSLGVTVENPSGLLDQDTPGTDYQTESIFHKSTLPGGLDQAGLATNGSRLVVRFGSVPVGTAIYVTTCALPNTGAVSAVLTSANLFGVGAFSEVPQTGTVQVNGQSVGIAPVAIVNGVGSATWEILDADPAALEQYTFGVIASGPLGTVIGGLGPIGGSPSTDYASPVPRFWDTYAETAACASSPCLTVAPGAIALSYQTAAAAPSPITLQVGSTGAPLSFTASVVAAPDGWLSVSPSSGSAPGTVQVTVTPGNLAPDVYRGDIRIVSGNQTVVVPLYLTVTVGQSGYVPLGCTANVANPTLARSPNMAEFLGDIVLTCTGGTPTPSGASVPTVELKVALDAPITSRLYANGWSEVQLVMDEAGAPFSSANPYPQLACNSPTGSCSVTGVGDASTTYNGTPGRPNVFAGKVSGNTVTFPNLPLDPPGAGGFQSFGQTIGRVLRIVNLRADITGYQPSMQGQTPVLASITAGTIPIRNPVQTTAFIFSALNFSRRTPDNADLSPGFIAGACYAPSPARAGVLRFGKAAFNTLKPRTDSAYVDADTSPTPQPQNQLTVMSANETGFYAPALSSPVVDFSTVGLVNFGTRLRARIDSIPSGARVWVSTRSVVFNSGVPALATNTVGRLVVNEIGAFAAAPSTTTLDGIPAAELTVTNGSASAVWEVLRAQWTNVNETFDFVYWIQSGASGQATVAGSLAPAPPSFLDSVGHVASATLPVPRFASDGTPLTLFTVPTCSSLSVTSTHTGNFTQGQTGATYTITVRNAPGAGATAGQVAVAAGLTSGLTLTAMSGSGWNCVGNGCSRSDSLAANSSYPPILVTVNVGAAAPSPQANSVSVSGGSSASANYVDSTTIVAPTASFTITKGHSGNFLQGQANAAYSITVANSAGAGPSTGTVTVSETIPSGLTLVSMSGTGWNCPSGGSSCTRSDSLGAGASFPPIVVTVNVSPSAASRVTNRATVSGGGSADATASDDTTIVGVAATVKAGVFRAGQWIVDRNGDGLWNGAPPDLLMYLGQAGDTYLVGDWNGDGRAKAGIFRAGLWVLDYNGNGVWDGPSVDRFFYLGQAGDRAVVGDWNGDGRAKAGVFRNGQWILDVNGNGVWDGLSVDRLMYLGETGDTPLVGDWNGDGRAKAGIFRAGLWVLDYNGNGVWDGPSVDRFFYLGQTGDTALVGDWNGDGRVKAGVFRDGLWVLDYNGSGVWDGPSVDRFFYLGQGGDAALVGDWNGDGRAKGGIFRAGLWVLDYNGSGVWDGPSVDRFFYLGQAGDSPAVGKWQ